MTKQVQKNSAHTRNVQVGRDLNIQNGLTFEQVKEVSEVIQQYSPQPVLDSETLISVQKIQSKIYFIRGAKVMLDRDLAGLYGVTTSALNRQVKRNLDRFPQDFKFQLTFEEVAFLMEKQGKEVKSQNSAFAKLPNVFTEQGVAMLSSVLRSKKAVQVNIDIMRAFVHFRYLVSGNRNLLEKINRLESRYDKQFKIVFDAMKEIVSLPEQPASGILSKP